MALSLERPVVTLRDLQTDYGLEDLYDLIEVGMVLSENRRRAVRHQEKLDADAQGTS